MPRSQFCGIPRPYKYFSASVTVSTGLLYGFGFAVGGGVVSAVSSRSSVDGAADDGAGLELDGFAAAEFAFGFDGGAVALLSEAAGAGFAEDGFDEAGFAEIGFGGAEAGDGEFAAGLFAG
jgi:hypothetical protein